MKFGDSGLTSGYGVELKARTCTLAVLQARQRDIADFEGVAMDGNWQSREWEIPFIPPSVGQSCKKMRIEACFGRFQWFVVSLAQMTRFDSEVIF